MQYGAAACTLVLALSWSGSINAQNQQQPHQNQEPAAARSAGQTNNPEQALGRGALKRAQIANPGDADIKHGLQIVMGAVGGTARNKTYACLTCHEINGQGKPGVFPRLTHQTFRYLYNSLLNYASGLRQDPIMGPVAKSLSKKDMRDVAAYYAAERPQPPVVPSAAKIAPSPESLIKGATLALIGSARDGVQACANCHGPSGAGLPPVYPYLAGQYAQYLETQLQDFRSGSRRGDPLEIMPGIAKQLTDEEIHNVAAYYASIQPPVAVPQKSFAGPLAIGAPLGPPQNGSNRTAGQPSGESTGQGAPK